jgi:hypothetical protein
LFAQFYGFFDCGFHSFIEFFTHFEHDFSIVQNLPQKFTVSPCQACDTNVVLYPRYWYAAVVLNDFLKRVGFEIFLSVPKDAGYQFLISLILGPLFFGGMIVIVWAVAESAVRESWKEKLSRGPFSPAEPC